MKKILILFLIILISCMDHIDHDPNYPDTIYYRLHQVDYDGADEYFDAISVQTNGRVLANWWDGVGNPIEARCNAQPADCTFPPGGFDDWCAANGGLCSSYCTKNPLICDTLPIELLDFQASFESDGVTIIFITASEIESDYVLIDVSTDFEHWKTIAEIPSKCPDGCKYTYFDDLSWNAKD
jgi:hypothetical protein